MKVAIVVGHNPANKGANALTPIFNHTNEYDFNNEIADLMISFAKGKGSKIKLKKFLRKKNRNILQEIKEAYQDIENWGADCSIELHFNSYDNPNVSGTETLHSSSRASINLANHLQNSMITNLQLKSRGLKPRSKKENGGGSLNIINVPSILVQPFFASCPNDRKQVSKLGKENFAKMYLQGLEEYFANDVQYNEINKSTKIEHNANNNFLLDIDLKTIDLNKNEFIERNINDIINTTNAVNYRIRSEHNWEKINELTLTDVLAVIYAEIGLFENGNVNPNHNHGNNKTGLFPLSTNLDFWNESGIDGSQSISSERNLIEFLLYLGNIKNTMLKRKFYSGYLYKDLFELHFINQDAKAQARILAAVVDGYFFPGAFESETQNSNLPYTSLAEKISNSNPEPIITILSELKHRNIYRNNDAIIRNHLQNVEKGISISKAYTSNINLEMNKF